MDMFDAFRYLGALALVLALIGGAGLLMRRYGLPGIAGMGRRLDDRRFAHARTQSPRHHLEMRRH